jgi:hypothetical protein
MTPTFPRYHLIATLFVAWAMLPSAHATVINQVDGNFRVHCVADSVQLPCVNGHYQRSATSRGVGPQFANDGFDNTYGVNINFPNGPIHQHYTSASWSAAAAAGNLKAGAFANLIVPGGDPVFSSELSAATAVAFFSDDWTIRGPANSLRRITLHFSLDGTIDDLAGVLLPFGQSYPAGGAASASLSTQVRLDSGSNRLLGPVAIGPSGGRLEQCIGRGGCGPAGHSAQAMDLVFDVAGGNLLSIFANLELDATGNAYADFLNTAKLDYVLAPDDIDISAGSGELIRSGDRFIYLANGSIDPPPAGVPEPGSALLLGLGLLLVAGGRQRVPGRSLRG